MYIYIHTYICTCIQTYIYIYIHAYTASNGESDPRWITESDPRWIVLQTYIYIYIHAYTASMQNDPTGVGFREYQLLRVKHKFSASRRPFNISNMPGEKKVETELRTRTCKIPFFHVRHHN